MTVSYSYNVQINKKTFKKTDSSNLHVNFLCLNNNCS